MQILHPLESALSVSLTVRDDAKPGWTIAELSSALLGSVPDVEGCYIEIESSGGKPLLQTTAAYRVGTGDLWFAPGQDERFGAVHGSAPWS